MRIEIEKILKVFFYKFLKCFQNYLNQMLLDFKNIGKNNYAFLSLVPVPEAV